MALVRFLFRLAASVALALAVILAIVDASRSLAANAFILTTLGETWSTLHGESLASAGEALSEWGVFRLDGAFEAVLDLPAFIIFAAASLLLYAIGYRPRRRIGRFVVDH